MPALSSAFCAHCSPHSEESAISLSWKSFAIPTIGARRQSIPGRASRSDPCISSNTTAIMITTSDSSVKRSGLLSQLLGVGLHTIAMFELAHVRTELDNFLVIPFVAPHPVQPDCQSSCHSNFGNLVPAPQGQMNVLVPPFWNAAHGNLGRLY